MNEMTVTLFEHTTDLPPLPSDNYFHSPELMALIEQTPRHRPLMAVVTGTDGSVIAHMLTVIRYRRSWFPPYLYTHARVMGEGVYQTDTTDSVFELMVEAVTHRLYHKVLYIEFSDLSHKMFGYRQLRKEGYFPVRWMSIHNSLHSRSPQERITPRQLKRIEHAIQRGVTTRTVSSEQDFKAFSKLLRHHNWLKPRHYIPDDEFFRGMMASGHCKIFISSYHDRVIGCSVSAYSQGDAYMWYSASRRKSYATLHPNAVTFWNTINDAYTAGYQHMRFLDVGLPFRKNPYRDFILRFGGKEVSTYRWFRINIRWVNAIASWLWRE